MTFVHGGSNNYQFWRTANTNGAAGGLQGDAVNGYPNGKGLSTSDNFDFRISLVSGQVGNVYGGWAVNHVVALPNGYLQMG